MNINARQSNHSVQGTNLLQDNHIYLSDLSSKDKQWDINKAKTDVASYYTRTTDLHSHSVRMYDCGAMLTFNQVPDLEGTIKLKLKQVWLCKVRECPMCSSLRSRVWQRRLLGGIPPMIDANPKIRFVFLTLTVRNCEITELRNTLDAMNHSFKKLMDRRNVAKVVQGYLRRFEVTKNEDGTAHPHFHIILAVMPSYFSQNYINQADWTQLWQDSLQVDYTPVVNIKAVKASKKCNDPHLSIINEVTKTACYCSKDKDLLSDKEWFLEHTRQVARTKEIVLSGLFRDFITDNPIDENDILNAVNDEDENESLDKQSELQFLYLREKKKYAKRL